MPIGIKPNRNKHQYYDDNVSAHAMDSIKNRMHFKIIFVYNLVRMFFYVKYTCDINLDAVIYG